MNSIKSLIRKKLPEPVYRSVIKGRDSLVRLGKLPGMYLHPRYWESHRSIQQFQNKYPGKRCFIIGNGPSLNKTDISFLKNEYTFGMNRVYLAFEEWGFQTSFLVSINDLVIEQCQSDFMKLDLPLFFSWHARNLILSKGFSPKEIYFLHSTYTGSRFSRLITGRFWEGSTVTYVCLQLAFCMGFTEVYLVGVDHSFETQGKANQTVISTGNDPNHFSPEYFGKGFRWQLPDLETSENAYRMAAEVYKTTDRFVFDATIDGKLDVFPKVDYYSLFS